MAKRKSTADQKAIHKRAYKKAISDLVAKKLANYDNFIGYNSYTDAIAKLREIGMTVNPAALRMAVHRSYRSMREVSTSSPVSTSSTLSSSSPSESTNNDNATGLNGRDIVCDNRDSSTPMSQGLTSSLGSTTTPSLVSTSSTLSSSLPSEFRNNDNAAGLDGRDTIVCGNQGSSTPKSQGLTSLPGSTTAPDLSSYLSSSGSTNNDDGKKAERKRKRGERFNDDGNKAAWKRKRAECIDHILLNYTDHQRKLRLPDGSVKKSKKGYLANLIQERMKVYGVVTTIPNNTIRTRFKRAKLRIARNTSTTPNKQQGGTLQVHQVAKHDWWLNVKEAEVDVDGEGTIIYTNGEVYLGKVTISDANGLGILSHESYETAGELHYRIVNDIKRSREKAKLAGIPYDAKRTRLELESVHGTMSLLFFDRDSVKCGETYLPLFATKGVCFGDNRHDYIFQK